MSTIRYKKHDFSTSVIVFLAIALVITIPVATVAQYYGFGNPAATDNTAVPSMDYPSSSYQTPSYPAPPPRSGQYGGNTVPATPQPIASSPMTLPQPWPDQVTQQPEQTPFPVFTQPQSSQPPQSGDVGIPAYQTYQPTPSAVPSNDFPITPAPMNVPAFDPTAGGNVNFDTPAFQPPELTSPSSISQGGEELPLLALGGVGNAYTPYSGTGQTGGTVPAFRTPGAQESMTGQGLVARERERRDDRRKADQEYIDTWHDIRDSKNTEAWKIRMPPYAGPLENRAPGDDASSILQVNYLSIKQDDYEYDWEREEKHYFSLSLLDPTRFGERMKAWVGLGPNEEKARKYMESGLQQMENGKNVKAAQDFEWAAYYAPETALEEDARYHAAECYYREKRFDKAVNQYTKLLENFPSSPYKNEAVHNMFEIARTWIKRVTEDKVNYVNVTDRSRPTFDTFGHAERALKTIFINCPNDHMADDSVFLLGHGYMRLGRTQGDASFERAAEYFKQLRDCYPNSEFVVEAMRLEIICREKSGLGADYDMRHVNEASKTAEQLQQQYGTRMPSDQRNELLEISNRLSEQKAKKLWVTGKFYDDRYDYGAARLLYQELINTYPASDYAEKARKRYEQIRDLPAELPSDWQRIKSVFRLRWG